MNQDEMLTALIRVVHDLVDPTPCRFDHHGGCQEHGHLSIQPGEVCPHEEGKRLLAAIGGTLEGS